jgi:hypothetical protein
MGKEQCALPPQGGAADRGSVSLCCCFAGSHEAGALVQAAGSVEFDGGWVRALCRVGWVGGWVIGWVYMGAE